MTTSGHPPANNNGDSSPVGPRTLQLKPNSRREVTLLCYLQLEQASTAHAKTLLKLSQRQASAEWTKWHASLSTKALSTMRELVTPEQLGLLQVQRDGANGTAPTDSSPVGPDKHRTRWGASYIMLANIMTGCLRETQQLLTTTSWSKFKTWMSQQIESLQWHLYSQNHEYVLDFSSFPKMLDWLEWDFDGTDTGEEGTEDSNGEEEETGDVSEQSSDGATSPKSGTKNESPCVVLHVGKGMPHLVVMQGGQSPSSESSSESSEDSEDVSTDMEDSEESDSASGPATRSSGRRPPASDAMAAGLLSFLMGLEKGGRRMGGLGSAASHAKTPESKTFMAALASRGKGGDKSAMMTHFDSLGKDARKALIRELTAVNKEKSNAPLLLRILLSSAPTSVKNEIMTRYENSRGEVGEKYLNWVNQVLKMPFDKHIVPKNVQAASTGDAKDIRSFLKGARETLDEVVYGHDDAKDKLVEYIAQMTRQAMNRRASGRSSSTSGDNAAQTTKGLVLGIQGPFGNGKTTLIEKGVSKVLGLPFSAIPLGGASDGAFLQGHGFTYEGSTCGQIASTLMKTQCSNPIIYMDELDKVSGSYKGEEVINQLVHLTDPSQNSHYQDRYFGNIDFDLSQVTWVFSYNDRSRIPPVLRDRITEVQTTGFTLPQKQVIARQFLLPAICKEIGMPEVSVPTDVVKHLIDCYTYEGGVRSIKKLLFEICRKLNVDDLCGKLTLDAPAPPASKRRCVQKASTAAPTTRSSPRAPYTVSLAQALQYLQHKTPMVKERIHTAPAVGRINGLYASSGVDMGGIIPIETKFVPSDHVYGLSLTGNLGKVMRESGTVAKTLALESTDAETRCRWEERWKTVKESIHLHCPEGAVSKDGPSAGTALTVAMLSLLTGNAIRHDIGITGEINLFGEVMAIGGLRSKMYGAKSAGCRLVLYPKDNQKDYTKIARECPDLFEDGFVAIPVSTLSEVLPHVLTGSRGLVEPLKEVMRKGVPTTTPSTTTKTNCNARCKGTRKSTRIANKTSLGKRPRSVNTDDE